MNNPILHLTAAEILSSLSAAEITARIKEVERERAALMVLRRAARRREIQQQLQPSEVSSAS